MLRSYAKYLRQAGFPYSQAHIETRRQRQPGHRALAGRTVRGAVRPGGRCPSARPDAQAAAAAVAADIDALTSLDTDRVLRGVRVDDPGHAAHQLLRHPAGFGARAERAVDQAESAADRRTAAAAADVRDLRLLAAGRGRAPAVRLRRPRRAALVGPPRGLPHRDPRPGQGAGREERRHRAGRRQGRIRRQEAARAHRRRRRRPRRAAQRGHRLLPAVHLRACSTSPTTSTPPPATSSPPADVVRRDGDDAYLVVAADKGTATFSDIANEVAKSYGFWLGDAFASGGSVGYDHKAMGITAKGAWESVKRHFREMGVDTQSEDFTVVGVGDMSGDVFGNGMLLSQHIRLVAAFDHLHVFLDPNPDAARSWEERKRMFDLPRSTWDDYDKSLISEGGGVYSREQKSIPISPQVRAALGLDDDVDELTPPELMRGDPEGAGRPAVERRHRHLRQGRDRVGRRRRRPRQRRGPGERKPGARQGDRRGRQPRRHIAGPHRVRPRRRPDQHRRDGQLRRRRLLRPRGQHQDPGRLAGHARARCRPTTARTCCCR